MFYQSKGIDRWLTYTDFLLSRLWQFVLQMDTGEVVQSESQQVEDCTFES